MNDILDKIKKVYAEKLVPFFKKMGEKTKGIGEKIKPLLEKIKPYIKKIIEFVKVQKRYFGVAGLFIVMILVLVFFTGESFNAKRIAKLNSKTVSGEDYVPDAEFEINAYPEINDLISEYFTAYVNADIETLDKLARPVSEMEKSYITMLSQFYEEYQNITCYTKHGLSKDSYIVSACFDIKFTGQEVTAPSMVLFYVQTDKNGGLYINNLYSDFNMKYAEEEIDKDVYTALRKYTTQADYLELFNEVDTQFSELIKDNNEIYQLTKRTIPGIRQAWEDNVYYVESTEEAEGTEVESPEAEQTPEEETPAPEVEQTPEAEAPAPEAETPAPEQTPEAETPVPEETPAPEPVVEKVRIDANNNVRVRSGAGTDFTKVGDAYDGDVFVKLGEETGSDGKVWIKIQFNDSTVGYVRADFVEAVTE